MGSVDQRGTSDALAEEAADALGVPEAQRPAFKEVYAAFAEQAGGQAPSATRLKGWQSNCLQQARAEVDVRAHLDVNGAPLRALAAECAAAGGDDSGAREAKLWRQLEQRFVFMGVYAADVPLEQLMERLHGELQSMLAPLRAEGDRQEAGAPLAFRLDHGEFDHRHRQLRKLAYPYTPACGSREGSEVIECLLQGSSNGAPSSTLVGYVAAHGKYADDVTVDPRYQGCGIGKALVCGWGKHAAGDGESMVTLDVRACNYPAFEMYKALGFEVVRKHYPGFYDWHGGFRLQAKTADLAARAPANFDLSNV